MATTTRRKFTPEFKNEATKLILDQGMTVSHVSRELAIGESALWRWVQQARIDRGQGKAGALTTEERAELSVLRREVKELRMEREILKKAAAFFAKEIR